jgi:hypothetical protein
MTTKASMPPVSDEAIRRGSGKGWDEWVAVLDAWGALDRSHTEIANHVHEAFGVDGWWAQSVTVGYERLKDLREVGEVAGGRFAGSASKTFPVPLDRLWQAWIDDAQRDQWLPPGTLTLRTAQEGRSARFDIAGGGILALWFTDKGAKSSVQLQQETLPSKEAADTFRATWKAHLANLAAYLAR